VIIADYLITFAVVQLKKSMIIENQHISILCQHFRNSVTFTVTDAFELYKQTEPQITKNAVTQRLYYFSKKGNIARIAKGIFAIDKNKTYKPIPEIVENKLYNELIGRFPLAKFCIWNTKLFNEFMLHQPARFYTLVETEKDVSEFVFNFLKENNYEVFLNPNEKLLNQYAFFSNKTLIVKYLITESPIQTIENIPTITIEKLLIDLFCDTQIFAAQQESELDNIFTSAFSTYTVDKTKLLRYSSRRGKKSEITELLKNLNIKL